jgi:ribosome-associated protein
LTKEACSGAMTTMNNQQRILEIERRLRDELKPLHLMIIDDSANHRGHAGAQDGRGHFSVKITAHAFEGKTLADRHRMIYTILDDMMTTEIHALQIDAKPIGLDELTQFVNDTLTDLKVKDIKILDVSSLTNVTDRMIICTATSTRHAASIADKLVTAVKRNGIRPYNSVEDQTETGWILVDLLSIVVHIMLTETREYYSLEKLWTVTETSRNSKDKT